MTVHGGSLSSTSSPALVSYLFEDGHSDRCEVFHRVLTWFSCFLIMWAHLSMCRWVICLPEVRITFVFCAFLPPTIRNVVESEYLSKLKKLVSHTFRKLMLYFLGSSAASAAVLESDKPGELPTDMPAGGGEAGDHGHAGGPVWHCWGHPGGQCGHPF